MVIELGASGMILTFGTRSFFVIPAKTGTQGGLRSADAKEKDQKSSVPFVPLASTPSENQNSERAQL